MRILVTGAHGFIGRACVKEFLAQGWHVRAISRYSYPKRPNLESIQIQNLEQIDWHQLVLNVDCVVHLAGIAHQKKISTNYYYAINVEVTERLAIAAMHAGVNHFIFLSSVAVYGRTQSGWIDECLDINPEDDYAKSKVTAEQRIKEISKDGKMMFSIIRIPMVYGPNAPGNFRRLEKLVRSGIPLPLAAATALRSYLGIGNLVSALVRIAESPAFKNQTYLLTDGEDLSTAKLIQLMADAIGVPCRLWWLPIVIIRVGASIIGRSSDADKLLKQLRVDCRSTQRELNWTPPFSVADGMRIAMLDGSRNMEHKYYSKG